MTTAAAELRNRLNVLRTLAAWEERLESLRIIGRLVDTLTAETHRADLEAAHKALLNHAEWEREHGDAQILAPGAEDIARSVDQGLNPVEPVEGELGGIHDLDGKALEFRAYPLLAKAGTTTEISNGSLVYEGYELGIIEARGAGTVLRLRGLVLDDVSVQARAGARVELEDCSLSGRYCSFGSMDSGSTARVRSSRFQTARAYASAGATLTVEDCSFHASRDAAVSANGPGAKVEVRGGAIASSPVGDYGASAYNGGSMQLNDVTLDACWVAVRALKECSQVTLNGCRVLRRRTKTVALAKQGGRVTLVNTTIDEEVRGLSDCDDESVVEVIDGG